MQHRHDSGASLLPSSCSLIFSCLRLLLSLHAELSTYLHVHLQERSWDSASLKATIAIHIINNHDLSVQGVSFSVNYNI